MNPKVSVIISTYSRNYGDGMCDNLLKRSIDSILNQEFTDFELIIIDDGSIDGTKDILQEYAINDKRIILKTFEQNSNLPAKRYNDGMLLSSAPYITFMFDDDLWYPSALKDLYDAITTEHKDCGMIYGLSDYFDTIKNIYIAKSFGRLWDNNEIEINNFICNNSVIVKREVINQVGGYDERPEMKRLCDWDLWLRISKKYKTQRISKLIGEVFAFYSDSISETVIYDFDVMKNISMNIDRPLPLKGCLMTNNYKTWWDTLSDDEMIGWFKNSLGDVDTPSRISVREFIKDNFNKEFFSILDMGCGISIEYEGYCQYDLTKNMEYTGVDESEKLLDYCRNKYPTAKFLHDNINSTKIDSEQFNIVLCRHVLEHQKYYHNIIREAFRLSKDIIIIILFIPLSDGDDVIQFIDSHGIDNRGFNVHNNIYNKNSFYDFINSLNCEIIKDKIIYNKLTDCGEQIIIFKKINKVTNN